jgi:hypothetical protein
MIILEHEQGTPEWLQDRCGLPTASNFSNIVTSAGFRSKSRQKYMEVLAGERLSETIKEGFKSVSMARGNELEGQARTTLSMIHDVDIVLVGLCLTDDKLYGCSPDGLIMSPKSGCEIKCPEFSAHREYYRNRRVPPTYWQQVQGEMLVCERDSWIFMSYFPGAKPLILTVQRDDNFCKILHRELVEFRMDLDELVATMAA